MPEQLKPVGRHRRTGKVEMVTYRMDPSVPWFAIIDPVLHEPALKPGKHGDLRTIALRDA